MEEHNKILAFKSLKAINIKEVEQGDIFRNLPFYSPDFLLKSKVNRFKNIIANEANTLFDDIIRNNNIIETKSIIYPTWAILASQECDIRKNFDLIFFPLVKYRDITNQDNLIKFIEEDIQKWTRFMYIPKNYIKSNNFGPFRVLLQNPFYVSYETIEKNLKYSWVTHITKKAKNMFVGKVTTLFTRTPVDELLFVEFNQIDIYFNNKWVESWNNKEKIPYERSADEIIDKIIEFYFLLKNENENSLFKKFKIIDFNLIEEIFKLINKTWLFKEENPYNIFYRELINKSKDNWFMIFYSFIEYAIFSKDSIFESFREYFKPLYKFSNEEDMKYLDYKQKCIRSDFQNLKLEILKAKLQSAITKKEQFLSYCKPFDKLRLFLIESDILDSSFNHPK